MFQDIKAQGCDQIACLGDIVGYGQEPKQCLDLVRSMGIPSVKGNFEEYAAAEDSLEGFNPVAAENMTWLRAQLTDDDRQWMRELPYVLVLSGFSLVHATLDQPQRWGYVFDKMAAAANFETQATPVAFFGHTHVPLAFNPRAQHRPLSACDNAGPGCEGIPATSAGRQGVEAGLA